MTRTNNSKFNFKAGCLLIPALFILIALVLVYNFRNGISVFIAKSMVVEDTFDRADAVLVLGGSIPDRLLEAAELYKEQKTDLILITKTLDPPGYRNLEEKNLETLYPLDHQIKAGILSRLGIPDSDFRILDAKMPNTYYEALQIYYFMERNSLDSVAVVTSKLHTRRTSIIFNDIAKGEFKVFIRPSRYDTFNPDNPYVVRKNAKSIFYELEKLLFYKLTRLFSAEYPALH